MSPREKAALDAQRQHNRPWSEEDIAKLKEQWPLLDAPGRQALCLELRRSYNAVRQCMSKIKRNARWLPIMEDESELRKEEREISSQAGWSMRLTPEALVSETVPGFSPAPGIVRVLRHRVR